MEIEKILDISAGETTISVNGKAAKWIVIASKYNLKPGEQLTYCEDYSNPLKNPLTIITGHDSSFMIIETSFIDGTVVNSLTLKKEDLKSIISEIKTRFKIFQ